MRRLAPLALALVCGCFGSGTEIGNPGVTTARVALTAFTSDAAAVTLPEQTPDGEDVVTILEAWVSVRKIELVQQEFCDASEEQELEIRGLVGDLAAQPLLSDLEVPKTEYCEVEVEIDAPGDATGPLGQDAIRIRGLRADGVPFDLATRQDFELELESHGQPFTIDETQKALLIAFDVLRWFEGVDLDQAELDGNHIQIDAGHNQALLSAFESSVARSLGVYRDDDEDGEVDDDEREPLAGEN